MLTWRPDTALSIIYTSSCDTTSLIGATRRVSDHEQEGVTLFLQAFPAAGRLALADTSTVAFAAFTVSQVSGGFVTSTVSYWTRPGNPGLLTIAGATPTDSLVSGTFAFEAATIPDTLPHRHLSGQFRVKYTVQPVYTVPGCGNAT